MEGSWEGSWEGSCRSTALHQPDVAWDGAAANSAGFRPAGSPPAGARLASTRPVWDPERRDPRPIPPLLQDEPGDRLASVASQEQTAAKSTRGGGGVHDIPHTQRREELRADQEPETRVRRDEVLQRPLAGGLALLGVHALTSGWGSN